MAVVVRLCFALKKTYAFVYDGLCSSSFDSYLNNIHFLNAVFYCASLGDPNSPRRYSGFALAEGWVLHRALVFRPSYVKVWRCLVHMVEAKFPAWQLILRYCLTYRRLAVAGYWLVVTSVTGRSEAPSKIASIREASI